MKFMLDQTSIIEPEQIECDEKFLQTRTITIERYEQLPPAEETAFGYAEETAFGYTGRILVSKEIEITEAFVEINSLEELLAFVAKYGLIVLSKNEIEIYDDYRE